MQAATRTSQGRTSKPALQRPAGSAISVRGDQSQAKAVTPAREGTGEGKRRKDCEKSGNRSARTIRSALMTAKKESLKRHPDQEPRACGELVAIGKG